MIPNYDSEIEKRVHPENFEMDRPEEDLEVDIEDKGVPTLLENGGVEWET